MADQVVLIPCRYCRGLVQVSLDEVNEGQKMLVGGQLVPAPPITAQTLAQVGVYHETCRERKTQTRAFSTLVEITELVDGKATEVVGSFEVTAEGDPGSTFAELLPQLSEKLQAAWGKMVQGANLVDMPDQTAGVVLVEDDPEPAAVQPARATMMGHPIVEGPPEPRLWRPES